MWLGNLARSQHRTAEAVHDWGDLYELTFGRDGDTVLFMDR